MATAVELPAEASALAHRGPGEGANARDVQDVVGFGDGKICPLGKQPEIEFAEFETRMRMSSLELVLPAITKTQQVEHEITDVRTEVKQIASTLADLVNMAGKVDQQVAVIQGFRGEMGRWSTERREFQVATQESVASMRQDMDAFRYRLEQQDTSIHSVQRSMDRMVGELKRVQERSDYLQDSVESRMGQHGRTLSSFRAETEQKLVALEARYSRLSDDVWAQQTGLAKVTGDLEKTNDLASSLQEDVMDIQHEKASKEQVSVVQGEVNFLMKEANGNITQLKRTVDSMMRDMKSHFQTATDTAAVHNAAMLQEVRNSYQEELGQSAKLRNEVTTFMQESQQHIARLEETIGKSQGTTEEMVKGMQADIQQVGILRKRDRNNTEVATQSVQEQLSSVTTSSESATRSVEHLSSIIWMLVQSERAASALDLQDDADRGKVALMGYRDSKAGGASAANGRAGAQGQARARSKAASPGADDVGSGPVISVDHRCLSCSGQAETVIAGFKMACLQYAAGPVAFAKKVYNRGELLNLKEKLINQAHEALQYGPAGFAQKDGLQKDAASYFGPDQSRGGTSILASTAASPTTRPRDCDPGRPSSRSSSDTNNSSVMRMPPLSARR